MTRGKGDSISRRMFCPHDQRVGSPRRMSKVSLSRRPCRFGDCMFLAGCQYRLLSFAHLDKARVYDVFDAVYGNTRFGDIGSENDLSCISGWCLEDQGLFFRWECGI